jgi:hypothetical protein
MGTEWFVLDKKNKRQFGMGKWEPIGEFIAGLTANPAPSYDQVLKILITTWNKGYVDHETGEHDEWIRKLAQRLWAFCCVADWQIEVRSDVTDYEDEWEGEGRLRQWKPHPLVISRYSGYIVDPDPCAAQQAHWEKVQKNAEVQLKESLAVSNLGRAQLQALFKHLDRTPLFKKEEGDYWEEDENGVVFLRRKDGTPVLMMPKADYEAMKKWREEA